MTLGIPQQIVNELDENQFKPNRIFPNSKISCHVLTVAQNTDLAIALSNIYPKNILRKRDNLIEPPDKVYVVMLEPDFALQRTLEIHFAQRKKTYPFSTDIMRCYSLFTKDTCEEYIYDTELLREKNSFKEMIDERSKLVIDLKDPNHEQVMNYMKDEEMKLRREGHRISADLMKKKLSSLTIDYNMLRKEIVAVDMREFKSALPHYLYDKGFWVIPATLVVGDYILTDDIAVERKAITTSDLFMSLKSGRLRKQVAQQCQHYKIPVLLIEFEEGKEFRLVDPYGKSVSDRDASSIWAQLTTLCINYPKLQLIWSSGPKQTANIFKLLKKGKPNPNMDIITKVGKVVSDVSGDKTHFQNKFMPKEFLRKFPGIDSNNIHTVTKRVKNMRDLCQMSEVELKDIIGPRGKQLYEFLHNKVKVRKKKQ